MPFVPFLLFVQFSTALFLLSVDLEQSSTLRTRTRQTRTRAWAGLGSNGGREGSRQRPLGEAGVEGRGWAKSTKSCKILQNPAKSSA
jgi:hypothetical protein